MSKPSSGQSVWSQTTSLIRPYFRDSSERGSAWALAILGLLLVVFTSYWFTRINQWGGAKTDALQTKNSVAFYALLPDFFLAALGACCCCSWQFFPVRIVGNPLAALDEQAVFAALAQS